MVFPIVGGTQSTGDFVTNSLRLNDDDSPYLERSLSSPNTDKFTVSCWVKLCGGRSQIANIGKRLTGEAGDNRSIDIEQGDNSNGRLGINAYNGVADANVAAYNSNTNAGPLLRDPTAWYHFVYAFDTGQASAGNRFKWYINGVLQSGFNTTTTPSQNADLFDSSGSGFRIGRAYNTESRYADMYVAEYYYVDGQQYDHTYFGEFNDNGVWVPVEKGKGAGGAITFGTNGFYLQFKETGTSANASGIGADTSGNDNHLTPTNLAALDITTDTPQNNFATLNPIDTGANLTRVTFSEGNTEIVKSGTTSNNGDQPTSSQGFVNGKWYWEVKVLSNADNTFIGIFNDVLGGLKPYHNNYFYGIYGGSVADGSVNGTQIYLSQESSQKGYGLSQSGGTAFSDNDILQFAFDTNTYRLYIGKNGQWTNNNSSGSAAPTGGSAFNQSTPTGYFEVPTAAAKAGVWRTAIVAAGSSENYSAEFNFGNPGFSISSGNSDANGHGNFEYAVPSGYFALNTKNLAEHG